MRLRTNKLGGLTAVNSSGFIPVGPVYGAGVFQIAGGANPVCSTGSVLAALGTVSARGPVVRFPDYERAVMTAKQNSIGALVDRAVVVGAHGVVGVTLTGEWLSLGGTAPLYRAAATGTAVRHPGMAVETGPFISAISGADFAKLLAGGLVPVGVVLGFAAFHVHGLATTARANNAQYKNAEMPWLTSAVSQARAEARRQLADDGRRLGGEVVLAATVTISGPLAASEDSACRNVFATAVGTAAVRFGSSSYQDVDVRKSLMM